MPSNAAKGLKTGFGVCLFCALGGVLSGAPAACVGTVAGGTGGGVTEPILAWAASAGRGAGIGTVCADADTPRHPTRYAARTRVRPVRAFRCAAIDPSRQPPQYRQPYMGRLWRFRGLMAPPHAGLIANGAILNSGRRPDFRE